MSTPRYWLYSAGRNAEKWNECRDNKMICIGWDDLGDLSLYESREAMRLKMQDIYGKGSYTNASLATWQFANEIKEGDIIIVKQGRSVILGKGIVSSKYRYDNTRSEYPNVISVDWEQTGRWGSEIIMPMKTLTDITGYKDMVERIEKMIDSYEFAPDNNNKWWICVNPKEWSLSDWVVGEEKKYLLTTASGNPRIVFDNFEDAKVGDIVVCFESGQTQQIVGLSIVTKEKDHESITIEKLESFTTPIGWSFVKDFSKEFSNNNLRSGFFKLTNEEYNYIYDIIRESNPINDEKVQPKVYSDKDFLSEVYITEKDLYALKQLLLSKKNVILQGAPGVGKTFTAKRLAYSIMGAKDEDKIGFVQFHQNYTYEDFVLGYKPSGDTFELQRGVFYRFCIKAANDPENSYFFIIDEINRGNISKIFGELLVLIEKGYRGTKMNLAYKEGSFSVPSNLFIIGMMNTADRSLSIIDYALRRRFSFYPLKAGFESDGFREYQKNLKSPKFDSLISVIKSLNDKIVNDDSLGEGFEIGHSYFCDQKEITDGWLHRVIDYDIVPLLQEYWFDNKKEIQSWVARLNSIFDD